ncbi:2Fe-2S iron-sulfur cluster-binding protein [Azovibrio restrictus]|uniref:2Fe-2S iron-sulfur cluster-binding protein n=1 Tax=Azovibrio restrictus TaxID=146938 RepID=UPI0026E98E57|nr:2Fe-2S iron-sulfur cluster-binding protein [Azovibrio restrictus]
MFFFGKKHPHQLTVLPHPALCPEGEIVPAIPGRSVAEILLQNRVEIDHSCQLQCACTTCHVHIMEGAQHLSPMEADERRMLDKVPGRDGFSRLACQAVFQGGGNVVVEIP